MAISLQTSELRTSTIAAAIGSFLFAGIAYAVIILASIAVTYSANLRCCSIPRIAMPWLSPSYLFVTVHFIIIVIWKLHGPKNQDKSALSASDPPDSVPDSSVRELHEEHESMDVTWKAIAERGTEAAEKADQPKVRKSDSWERCGDKNPERKFGKSETFRRVSVGREELFGLAEAFIRTHYEQQRIQRQESVQRYVQMVNAAG